MKKNFTLVIATILLLSFLQNANAQTNTFPASGKVGIGTTTPNASSLLEIKSTNKGILIPRLTQAQRDAIPAPANGLLIYQTDNNPGFFYYTGSAWLGVQAKGKTWSLTGNQGSSSTTNFIGTSDAVDLVSRTNNIERMRIKSNGFVGIGTSSPSSLLHVAGTETLGGNLNFTSDQQSIQFANPGSAPLPMMYMFTSGTINTARMVIAHSPSYPTWGLQYTDLTDQFDFVGGGTSRMTVQLGSGNVGIGVTSPVYKLEVCGTIRAKEVRVETGWCDYVFEKDYKLKSFDELEKYINENKHLPGIAPASEVEKDGLKVGEMNKAMMEKIEELTLYVIQLSKDNEKLQKQIDALKK